MSERGCFKSKPSGEVFSGCFCAERTRVTAMGMLEVEVKIKMNMKI